MSGKCEFKALPSADAFGGLLCTACGETFEKEPVCPKRASLPTKLERVAVDPAIQALIDHLGLHESVEGLIREQSKRGRDDAEVTTC